MDKAKKHMHKCVFNTDIFSQLDVGTKNKTATTTEKLNKGTVRVLETLV